jgi:hypothetical protein
MAIIHCGGISYSEIPIFKPALGPRGQFQNETIAQPLCGTY